MLFHVEIHTIQLNFQLVRLIKNGDSIFPDNVINSPLIVTNGTFSAFLNRNWQQMLFTQMFVQNIKTKELAHCNAFIDRAFPENRFSMEFYCVLSCHEFKFKFVFFPFIFSYNFIKFFPLPTNITKNGDSWCKTKISNDRREKKENSVSMGFFFEGYQRESWQNAI